MHKQIVELVNHHYPWTFRLLFSEEVSNLTNRYGKVSRQRSAKHFTRQSLEQILHILNGGSIVLQYLRFFEALQDLRTNQGFSSAGHPSYQKTLTLHVPVNGSLYKSLDGLFLFVSEAHLLGDVIPLEDGKGFGFRIED